MRKMHLGIAIAAIAIVYVVFFPSPTAQLAVRKHLLLSFHPIKAFGNDVRKGSITNDPKYGDLYEVDGLEASVIYVKKNALGWRVSSTGTAP